IRTIKKSKKFIKFVRAMIIISFATGIASAFFTVQLVKKFNASFLDIAILTIISSLSRLLILKPWGFLVYFIGRRSVMLATLTFISLYPLVYAFSPSLIFVYLFTVVGSSAWAGFEIASFTYFSESLERRKIVEFTATYNFLTQMTQVIAKFLGGVLAEFYGITLVFIISFLVRILSFFFFSRVEERIGPIEMPIEVEVGETKFLALGHTIAIYAKLFSILKKDFKRSRKTIIKKIRKFLFSLKRIFERKTT
ncbi:MAG: MFS transporter, partial [Candidatus Aenigmarchaeota archaeon]|nr:MFS transporter [Candidatus Aenigmarchaeota archaeon]